MAYAADLKAQQGDPADQLKWIAGRAAGEGLAPATAILTSLASPELWREMRLAPPSVPAVSADNPYLIGDLDLLQTAFSFSVHLASNIAWGQLLYRYTLPLAAAGLLAETPATRC